jgi:DNA-binding response OmpR family regulator
VANDPQGLNLPISGGAHLSTRILLVDDDEFARNFVRVVLERSGFEVHEAQDVAAAMLSAKSLDLDAVVTDWNLPDGNGRVLARHLHEKSAELPVILITGDVVGADVLGSELESEFTAILHKPFSPSALERAVRVAMTH